jgi:hypothetical protein
MRSQTDDADECNRDGYANHLNIRLPSTPFLRASDESPQGIATALARPQRQRPLYFSANTPLPAITPLMLMSTR